MKLEGDAASFIDPTLPFEVVVVEASTDYYPVFTANVRWNDITWSFDCTHLHHTAHAAQKHFTKVIKAFTVWYDNPKTVISTLDRYGSPLSRYNPHLVEMRLLNTSLRMSPVS